MDKRLWDKTMLEVERGRLLGPMPGDSLKEGATLSRGFFPWNKLGRYFP